jgi:hypothetical protein
MNGQIVCDEMREYPGHLDRRLKWVFIAIGVFGLLILALSIVDVLFGTRFGYPIYIPAIAATISFTGFRMRRAIIENPHSRLRD